MIDFGECNVFDSEFGLIKISNKKWQNAKMYFLEHEDKNTFQPKESGPIFFKQENDNIYVVVKDFFGEFDNDFIEVHIFEEGQTYFHILTQSLEAKLAFEAVLQKYNVKFSYVESVYGALGEIVLPEGFHSKNYSECVQKDFSIMYRHLLVKNLIKELLFNPECTFEQRQKLYRGIFCLSQSTDILKDTHELISLYLTEDNSRRVIFELEHLLTKVILIDRAKRSIYPLVNYLQNPNEMSEPDIVQPEQVKLYLDIIQKLIKNGAINDNELNVFQNQLGMSASQATTYNNKRIKLIADIENNKLNGLENLEKIIKFNFTEEVKKTSLDHLSQQYANALKNISYQSFLKIEPEDFYRSAWSKNTSNLNLPGEAIRNIISAYNWLSHQVTNDITHGLSYLHQINVTLFYITTCTKLIEAGDFNNAHAIYSGLSHSAVSRLSYLNSNPDIKNMLSEIEKLFSYESSMKNYRAAVKVALNLNKIVIPFLGLHLKELTFGDDGNSVLKADSSLNLETVELLGEMHGHLDDILAQLYRASPLQSCVALKQIAAATLDDDKTHELSLHAFPKIIPDVSKCKTITDLSNGLLIKRSLPLYLNLIYHHTAYVMPKVYSKILDILEEKIYKKDAPAKEIEIGLQLTNKIKLHASRNYMLNPELAKRIEKINNYCLDKTKSLEIFAFGLSDSESSFDRRPKV